VAFWLALACVVVIIGCLVRQASTMWQPGPGARRRTFQGLAVGIGESVPLAAFHIQGPHHRPCARVQHWMIASDRVLAKGRQVARISAHVVDHHGGLVATAAPLSPWVTGKRG
jgi:hypothetical protein